MFATFRKDKSYLKKLSYKTCHSDHQSECTAKLKLSISSINNVLYDGIDEKYGFKRTFHRKNCFPKLSLLIPSMNSFLKINL